MTKRKPLGRKPNVQVIRGVEGNMLQHDIGIVVTKQGYMLYIDPEIKIVLDHIVAEHNAVAIKINWHSKDLMLFIPPDMEAAIRQFAATATDLLKTQPLDGADNLTPEADNTATETEKTE